MRLNRIKRIFVIYCAFQFSFLLPSTDFVVQMDPLFVTDVSAEAGGKQIGNKPDIKWFKQEMKISPKYQEKKEGILGMSWNHFLTMAFLVVFFFGAFLVYHLRTVRTQQILERLLKEEENKNGT